jgi:hypothetical protein
MAETEKPLFNFTAGQFEDLMATEGLEKTTRVIVEDGNDMLGGGVMTYESMRDGTAPLLDMLPAYSGMAPEKRNLSDEAILSIFTNVEDYGRYDPGSTGEGTKTEAAIQGGLRAAPEAIAGGYGFAYGMRGAAPLAGMIPPLGLPGLLAKGVVLVGGGIVGSILAATAAGEVEDAVLGEKAPVMPSLQAANNFGEGLTYGVSMLHAPWTMNPEKLKRAGPGAVEFLSNFKNVASGKFAGKAAETAIELTAKNAGLSGSAYKAANAAREGVKKGPMFGAAKGTDILGLGRVNPAGYIFNPVKGPVAGRVMGGIESGFGKSLQYAADRPLRFLTLEIGAGAGAGVLSSVAQNVDPYDQGTRFGAEIAGAALVPIPLQLLVEKGPQGVMAVVRKMGQWVSSDTTKEGLMKGKTEREAGKRILKALEESSEYEGPEQIEALIDSLMKQSLDAEGNPVPGTVSSLAAAFGMPMNKSLKIIEDQLGRANEELSVATSRGRDQMLTQAKSAIADILATGDPDAMAVAARLQQSIFEQNITDNMEQRVSKFYEAAGKVVGGDPDGGSQRVDLSRQLYEVLNAQIQGSKKVERELWSSIGDFKIDQFKAKNGRVMATPNLLNLLDKNSAKGGLKAASKAGQSRLDQALGPLKEDIDDFRAFFQPTDGVAPSGGSPVTSTRLVEMRSAAQDKAGELRAQGKVQLAQRMDMVSDALLRDLTGLDSSDNAAYNAARAYTFARNNVFTRSFLGDMQVKDKNRAFQLSPEALADSMLRGGNRATLERINEINTAGRFGLEHFLPDAALNNTSTQETLDLVIRDSLRNVMDKKPVLNPVTKQPTGEFEFVVNENKLATWKKQPGTQELFTVFPNLAKDLETAQSVKNLQVTADNDLLNLGKSPQTMAFQTVLQYQDKPSEAVAKALRGNSPAKSLKELVDLANASPKIYDEVNGLELTSKDARLGLRNAIMDYAVIHSGGSGLSFSPTRFEDQLFAQVKGVSPNVKFTMMDFMKDNDMITPEEISKIQRAVKQMRGIEDAFHTGDLESVLFKNPSLSKMMYTRMLGATFGQKAQETLNQLLGKIGLGTGGGGIGGGMVAAQSGSEAIQQLLLRGPESMTVKTMSNLFANPDLLGPLLKDITNKQSADAAMKAMAEGFAGLSRQTGRRLPYILRYAQEEPIGEVVTEEVVTEPVVEQPAPVKQQVLPPSNIQGSMNPSAMAPTIGGGSAPSPVLQAPAAPQRPPVNQSGPVDRARFAALFPEDRELMGIGSLMGGAQ